MSQNNTPLVSVIVPCYNVDMYVEQCLLSIINQTYSNIEILAVDDGSPDETPAILDRLAAKYPPLKVIHQKNAGVSTARNTGLQQATGEYVMFVDGDDFLAPDAVAYFMDLVRQTGAEFCLSTCWFSYRNDPQTRKQFIKTLSTEQTLALLISPDTTVYSPNKIYRRSFLLEHHCFFPQNLFYGEGFTFVTNVAKLSRKIGAGNRKVYYYRKNNAGSATTRFDMEKMKNGIAAIDGIERNLPLHTPSIQTMLLLHRCTFYLGAALRLQTARQVAKYQAEYQQYISFVRRNYLKLIFKKEVSLYRKCMLLGGCISPWLLAKLDVIRRKCIAKHSV